LARRRCEPPGAAGCRRPASALPRRDCRRQLPFVRAC
jgi:hypothetical protein